MTAQQQDPVSTVAKLLRCSPERLSSMGTTYDPDYGKTVSVVKDNQTHEKYEVFGQWVIVSGDATEDITFRFAKKVLADLGIKGSLEDGDTRKMEGYLCRIVKSPNRKMTFCMRGRWIRAG